MDEALTLIALGGGYVATVDSDTFVKLRLGRYQWRPQVHKRAGKVYAVTYLGYDVYLHRLILNAPKGIHVDHKDGDGLNNRRSNIRLSTPGQNRANCGATRRKMSCAFKGVAWSQTSRKWMATVMKDGIRYYLGVYEHKRRAAVAHDRAALALFGEFAGLNFPGRKTHLKMPTASKRRL